VNNHVTYRQVVARLEEHNLPYGVLPLHDGVSVIVTQRGGRVLGPFPHDDAEGLFWMSAAWADAEAFKALLDSGGGNVGGERIWIAPEIQYNIRDRNDFDGSYHLPPQIDPGTYALDQPRADEWRLRQSMKLEAYNVTSGQKTLDLEIRVHPVPDPLRGLAAYAALLDGVTYAGYEQIVTLSERQTDAILSGSWNLIQLNPGGRLIIPIAPPFEVTDYGRGPLPADTRTRRDGGYLDITITGSQKYKVGYKAAHVTGRLAYLDRLDRDRAYLLVRDFTNNPSSIYSEEPAQRPGTIGDSVHVYNDSGEIGGFGEMECQGQTIGGATGRSSATDRFSLWVYIGDTEKLRAIAGHLLAVTWTYDERDSVSPAVAAKKQTQMR
jgi:hypothetical protein